VNYHSVLEAWRHRFVYVKNWKSQLQRPNRKAFLRSAPLISIVDDDESIREATEGLMRSLGYQAATFASAEEFLRSDSVGDTSCLIADVQMPGLSGVDLQRHLIAQGVHVPTIFITAFPEEGTRTHAMTAGAFGYLGKPFSEESLLRCLDSALAGSGDKVSQG
jgi:FixJ family two-component response regulator